MPGHRQTRHEYEQAVVEEDRRRSISKHAESAQSRAEAALVMLARVQRQAAREAARRDEHQTEAESAKIALTAAKNKADKVRADLRVACRRARPLLSAHHMIWLQLKEEVSRLQELQATLAPAEAKLKAARTATSVAEDHRREIQVAISAAQADLHRLEGEAAASAERCQQLRHEVCVQFAR